MANDKTNHTPESDYIDEISDIVDARFGGDFKAAAEFMILITQYGNSRDLDGQIDGELSLLQKMKQSYGRGSVKLYDGPENNYNNVYLDDRIADLKKHKEGLL